MAIIKRYTQWLNEDAQAAPVAGTSGPGAKPEGYTLKSNGVAYQYPFADDLAHSKYQYWNATDGSITDAGSSNDENSNRVALKKIMPSQGSISLTRDPNNPTKKTFGGSIVDSVTAALEIHALRGLKSPMKLAQMNALATGGSDNVDVTIVKNMYSMLDSSDRQSGKKWVAEWDTNWPKIWREQCVKAGMPWVSTTPPVTPPAQG